MTASASMVLIVGGRMMYFTNHYGYSNEGTMANNAFGSYGSQSLCVGGYLSYKELTAGELWDHIKKILNPKIC